MKAPWLYYSVIHDAFKNNASSGLNVVDVVFLVFFQNEMHPMIIFHHNNAIVQMYC